MKWMQIELHSSCINMTSISPEETGSLLSFSARELGTSDCRRSGSRNVSDRTFTVTADRPVIMDK